MLMTIFVILILLWLAGVISAQTFGGFLHFLLLLAAGVVVIRIVGGCRHG